MRRMRRVFPRAEDGRVSEGEHMRTRRLNVEEHEFTRSLYEEIFHEDSRSFVDYYYSEKTKDNTIFVVEEDRGIQAMIHLNPYPLLINGQERMSHYIVAVSTREKYRKKGYMAALLKESLQYMYRRKEPFTFLMPVDERIYTPHGFLTVYEQEQRYLTDGDQEKWPPGARKAKREDSVRLAAFAGDILKENYQVYAKRTPEYYERLIQEYKSDGGKLILFERDGEIVDCRPCVPSDSGGKAKIMIRIVHVESMLGLLRLKSPIKVGFHVTDPIILENQKYLFLSGTKSVNAAAETGMRETDGGRLTVEALESLVFGVKSVEELACENGVVLTEIMKRELRKIEPLSKIYLNEIV